MRSLIVLYFSVLIVSPTRADTTFTTAGSPYHISSDLVHPLGEIVTIEEGVTILLADSANWTIQGNCNFNGTRSNPIQIYPQNATGFWGSLNMIKPDSKCIMNYVNIRDGIIRTQRVDIAMNHVNFSIANKNLVWDDAVCRIIEGSADIRNCNLVSNNTGEGIIIDNPKSAPLVDLCTFDHVPDGVEIISSKGGIVRNCTFTDGADDAIDLNDCHHVFLIGNYISNYADRGMEIGSENAGSSTSVRVARNVIVDCKEGINIKEGSSAYLRNNTLHGNVTGLSVLEDAAGKGASTAIVKNTIISNSTAKNIDVDAISVVNITYSLVENEIVFGKGNIIGNPLFVSQEISDFQLQSNSPCINAGDPELLDPDGTVSDIGAHFFDLTGTNSSICTFYDVFSNPSTGIVYFKFGLSETANVKVSILSITGQLLAVLTDESREAKSMQVTWNGQMGNSETTGSGLYFVRLEINGTLLMGKKFIYLNQ